MVVGRKIILSFLSYALFFDLCSILATTSLLCCMSISPSLIQSFMVVEDRDRKKGHLLLEGKCYLLSCVCVYANS